MGLFEDQHCICAHVCVREGGSFCALDMLDLKSFITFSSLIKLDINIASGNELVSFVYCLKALN